MKLIRGVWLPDSESHLVGFLERDQVDGIGVYQHHKLQAALKYVKDFRCAVDVGGHCGLWSMHMAKRFGKVYAFEPVAEHRACFVRNAPQVELFDCALGHKPGVVRLTTGPASTGDTYVCDTGEHMAEVRTLDSFGIMTVDFMKIDCEGYELFVLQGAADTIERCKPVVIVEQKPGKGNQFGLDDTAAVKWLEKRGYRLREAIAGDYILSTSPE